MPDFANYSIITPDGVTFDLAGMGLTVGVGDIQDGMGLPPIEHKTWPLYGSAGAFLRGVQVGPRAVMINATLDGGCLEKLHDLRNKLWQSVRWNRTLSNPPDAARLRYTLRGKSADLYVHYAGDVTARVGSSNTDQTVGLRLIAYDPMWYDSTQIIGSTNIISSVNVAYIAARIAGEWDNLGGTGTGAVYAIAISADGDTVYVGGNFSNWAGLGAAAENIVQYTISTDTWAVLGAGLTAGAPGLAEVKTLAIGPDGILYVGGYFEDAGGVANADFIAKWNGVAWSALGGGLNATVYSIAIDQNYVIYAGGAFLNAGGDLDADFIARFTGGAWSSLNATPLNGTVYAIIVQPNGTSLFVGGDFHNAGGIANADHITEWHGSTWLALGSSTIGDTVLALAIGLDGILYLGGNFHDAGGDTNADHIAKWNGTAYSSLGGAAPNDIVLTIAISDSGLVYAGGWFTAVGSLTLTDRVAVFNNSAWSQLDIDLPGAAVVFAIALDGNNVFVGFNTTGPTYCGNPDTITTLGDYETFPIFSVTGPGTLQHIVNLTSGEQLIFNLYINPGEVITIDLSPGVKSIETSWPPRPSAMAGLSLPQSDLGSWSLKPDPIAPAGVNTISMYMTGTTPAVLNDDQGPAGAAQLDDWEDITGITCLNTDTGGILYVSIIADGGGFFHVALYNDMARTYLVGHTASYNGAGAQAIVADNASGLGGTITIVSATAADANIIAYFATACIRYFNRHLSIDHAMQP